MNLNIISLEAKTEGLHELVSDESIRSFQLKCCHEINSDLHEHKCPVLGITYSRNLWLLLLCKTYCLELYLTDIISYYN